MHAPSDNYHVKNQTELAYGEQNLWNENLDQVEPKVHLTLEFPVALCPFGLWLELTALWHSSYEPPR